MKYIRFLFKKNQQLWGNSCLHTKNESNASRNCQRRMKPVRREKRLACLTATFPQWMKKKKSNQLFKVWAVFSSYCIYIYSAFKVLQVKQLLLQAVLSQSLFRLNYIKSCWHKIHIFSADKSKFFHNCQVGKNYSKKDTPFPQAQFVKRNKKPWQLQMEHIENRSCAFPIGTVYPSDVDAA